MSRRSWNPDKSTSELHLASDVLRNLFADVYQKAGLPWDEEQESKLDLVIACIADAAVIEARNERKGLANRRSSRRL